MALDDTAIVKEVLAGDREAFRLLVDRYQDRVYHGVWRIIRDPDEAEDIAQEAFVRAFTRLGDYDERWAFGTWILTIATRMALNALRNRKTRPTDSLEDLPPGHEPSGAPDEPRERAAAGEWMERLRREVESLSAKMRLIFSLRHEDGLSIADIAQATGASESAVKVMLHRARKILRERLVEFADMG